MFWTVALLIRPWPWRLPKAVPVAVVAALLVGAMGPARACGSTTDCSIGERTYRIVLPTARDSAEPLGAIVFAHGYRGSAEGTLQNAALVGLADAFDLAIVAADAGGADWRLPGAPGSPDADGVAALAYFDALRQDLIDRFGVDAERIVAAGFSAGGMMVWHLACHRGDDFLGFVPLSGTFWAPLPVACPTTAVDLIHYHGTLDMVVPLEGRSINTSRQGNVQDAIALFAVSGGYRPVASEPAAGLDCELALNSEGQRLELCLYDGGHGFAVAHLVRALGLLGLTPDG